MNDEPVRDRDWAEAFGTVVSRLMSDRQMSTYRMAGIMGRPVNTINRYVLGQRVPPATVMVGIAGSLNVGVEALAASVEAMAEKITKERTKKSN